MDINLARQMYPDGGDIVIKGLSEMGPDMLSIGLASHKMTTMKGGKFALLDDPDERSYAYVFAVGAGEDHFVCQHVNYELHTIMKTIIYAD